MPPVATTQQRHGGRERAPDIVSVAATMAHASYGANRVPGIGLTDRYRQQNTPLTEDTEGDRHCC